jgi:hypothetical protein
VARPDVADHRPDGRPVAHVERVEASRSDGAAETLGPARPVSGSISPTVTVTPRLAIAWAVAGPLP